MRSCRTPRSRPARPWTVRACSALLVAGLLATSPTLVTPASASPAVAVQETAVSDEPSGDATPSADGLSSDDVDAATTFADTDAPAVAATGDTEESDDAAPVEIDPATPTTTVLADDIGADDETPVVSEGQAGAEVPVASDEKADTEVPVVADEQADTEVPVVADEQGDAGATAEPWAVTSSSSTAVPGGITNPLSFSAAQESNTYKVVEAPEGTTIESIATTGGSLVGERWTISADRRTARETVVNTTNGATAVVSLVLRVDPSVPIRTSTAARWQVRHTVFGVASAGTLDVLVVEPEQLPPAVGSVARAGLAELSIVPSVGRRGVVQITAPVGARVEYVRGGPAGTFTISSDGSVAVSTARQWGDGAGFTVGIRVASATAAGSTLTGSILITEDGISTPVLARGTISISVVDNTPAPQFLNHPDSVTVEPGAFYTFTVEVTNPSTTQIGWQRLDPHDVRGWVTVQEPGIGLTSFIGTAAETDHLASFRAFAVNSVGTSYSNVASLNVAGTPITITRQPQDVYVAPRGFVRVSVEATGGAGRFAPAEAYLQYVDPATGEWRDWMSSSFVSSTATSAFWQDDFPQAGDRVAYRMRVRSAAGTEAISDIATINVGTAPSITAEPADVTVADGESAVLSVSAAGTDDLSVQWQWRTGPDADWSPAGEESATTWELTTSALPVRDFLEYRAVVTNPWGSATSRAARVTVEGVAPTITTQPADVTVVAGSEAVLNVEAAGSGPQSVQWQWRSGADSEWRDAGEASATSWELTTSVLAAERDGVQYRAVVTSPYGEATSNPATVTVTSVVAPSAVLTLTAQVRLVDRLTF